MVHTIEEIQNVLSKLPHNEVTKKDIEKIIINYPNAIKLYNSNKKYITSCEVEKNLIFHSDLTYLSLYQQRVSFIVKNNNVPILLQNFIQYTFKRPDFKNVAVLENKSNASTESYKVLLTKVCFENIIADPKYDLIDFIMERSIKRDEEESCKKRCGFYLHVNLTEPKKYEKMVQYDYFTPFIVEDDNTITILEKCESLKYELFDTVHKNIPYVLSYVAISGPSFEPEKSLLESLIYKLNLKTTVEKLKVMFKDTYTITKTEKRETTYSDLFHNIVYDNSDTNQYLHETFCNITFYLRFFHNYEHQRNFYISLMNRALDLIGLLVMDTINEFNNRDTESHKFKDNTNETIGILTRLKKTIKYDKTHFKISPNFDFLFRFICNSNNVLYGSEHLVVDNSFSFSFSLCIEQINEFRKQMNDVLETSFSNETKSLYEEKNKLFKKYLAEK